MYNYLDAYGALRIAQVNSLLSGTDNDLSKADISLDVDLLSDNQNDKRYMMKFESYEEDNTKEAPTFNANALFELTFKIPNGDTEKYKTVIDNYVRVLVMCIYHNHKYNPSNLWSLEVRKISANKLNEFDESGDFKCTVGMECVIIDNIPLDLAVPSAPTLTSPADGYTSGLTNQSFNWTGTAETWDFKLVQGTTEILLQTGLLNSSFTIPADALLTDGLTYSWTARGVNAAGTGDWATAFTFTVDDTVITAQTPLQVGLDDLWVRGDDITLTSGAVSSWNDKSGNARHLTNSTSGNRPITETLFGKTFVKFEGTSTAIRNLSVVDSAHLFKLTGTQTRTFAFALYTRDNTAGRFNTIMGRTNNNVGDEWFFRLPTNFGSSPSYKHYEFPKSLASSGDVVLPELTGTLRHVILEVSATATKIYIDGKLISSATVTFNSDPSLPATAATFFVLGGGRQPSATQGTFAGAIGDFSTGDVALTTGQVASLYKYYQDYFGV